MLAENALRMTARHPGVQYAASAFVAFRHYRDLTSGAPLRLSPEIGVSTVVTAAGGNGAGRSHD